MSKLTFILSSTLLLAGSLMAQDRVDWRRENQRDRVAQGIRSGSLTARETTHLEGREAQINQEIRTDRRDNGGYLTAGEKRQVNRQQNFVSGRIYDDKHDRFHQ
jgi:hypothetical protein